jgi:hypothetical protein
MPLTFARDGKWQSISHLLRWQRIRRLVLSTEVGYRKQCDLRFEFVSFGWKLGIFYSSNATAASLTSHPAVQPWIVSVVPRQAIARMSWRRDSCGASACFAASWVVWSGTDGFCMSLRNATGNRTYCSFWQGHSQRLMGPVTVMFMKNATEH